ncbi:TPA: putative holin-like toxin [Enterococcus faecalis]|nr:putative holin-like toxin [Enterococcus faecalis]
MNVLPKSIERRSLLSVSESLQLMLAFGGFTLTLITTIVAILNYKEKTKRNNRHFSRRPVISK